MRTALATALLLTALAAPVAAAPAKPEFRFYVGETETFDAAGKSLSKAGVLIERVTDPARGVIVERVIQPDHRKQGRYKAFLVTIRVNAKTGKLTMTENSRAFKGKGSLTGPAWAWTAWHTTSTLPDGMTVDSVDTLVNGHLVAKKTVNDAQGKLVAKLVEDAHAIDAAAFEENYYRWMMK